MRNIMVGHRLRSQSLVSQTAREVVISLNFRRVRRRYLSPLPSGTMDEDHRTFLVSRCVLIVHAYYSHLAFSTHLGNADSSFIGWTSCSTAFLRNSFFLPSPVLGLVIGLHEVLNVGMRGVLV